jgi:hypothetical protein
LISVVLLIPLCLAAWTMTWLTWFQLPRTDWMRIAAAGTLALYMVAQFLRRSWFHGAFSASLSRAAFFAITGSRLVFVALTALIAYRGIRQQRAGWFAIPALLLVSVGLFAQELSELGIKGIWFPFGTGVSRTQFAYAAFDVAMFALLWRHGQIFAERCRSLTGA